MNTSKLNYMKGLAVALTLGGVFASCTMDEPFKNNAEGTLTLTTEIRGNVIKTRAIGSDEMASLREKCVVYIENDKGVVRKYKGLDNIPEQITLRAGSYVAEAWSGDSVSASFDSKFYRGKENFTIQEGTQALTLKCNIANVLVSVDPASLNVNLKDLKVTFSHSRGSLVFDAENIPTAKGYFMMPNADKNLKYVVEGTKATGEAFSKEGVIENVQRAHEYVMTITEDETPVTEGGGLIRLVIADIPVIEEEVEVFPAPAIRGIDFDIDSQLDYSKGFSKDIQVYIRGYFGLSSVLMTCSSNFGTFSPEMNILNGSVISSLNEKGIKIDQKKTRDAATSLDEGEVEVDEMYVTFTKDFLESLPASDTEFTVSFEATDAKRKSNTVTLRFANTEGAVEHLDPVGVADAPDPDKDPMAVLATSATLTAYIYDSAAATNYGIEYREAGTADWTRVTPTRSVRSTRAQLIPYTVTISGLKPGTTYEYKAFCDGFESDVVNTFTTESEFVIPNASMEDWSSYSAKTMLGTKNVILPWNDGDKSLSFWGSGNEGSATANITLTDKSTDMIHSGTYAARLESKSAMGVIAAGNLFIGEYVKTDGTDGVLSLGREYNGSHPTKLQVWANYRPASGVSVKSGNESLIDDLKAGGTDQAQIYVALTTEKVEIRTKASDRKLFNVDDPEVVAYGQQTFKGNYGSDGALEKLEIPIEYKANAKTTKPVYLIVVVSASKFGDFFSGAAGSVMYLDDFKLIYE